MGQTYSKSKDDNPRNALLENLGDDNSPSPGRVNSTRVYFSSLKCDDFLSRKKQWYGRVSRPTFYTCLTIMSTPNGSLSFALSKGFGV